MLLLLACLPLFRRPFLLCFPDLFCAAFFFLTPLGAERWCHTVRTARWWLLLVVTTVGSLVLNTTLNCPCLQTACAAAAAPSEWHAAAAAALAAFSTPFFLLRENRPFPAAKLAMLNADLLNCVREGSTTVSLSLHTRKSTPQSNGI